MDRHIFEVTCYFDEKCIDDLNESDQLLYYKLLALFGGNDVNISDEDIVKLKCVRLLCDKKYKEKLRAVDVIVGGDYPMLLEKILSNNCYTELNNDLFELADLYSRHNCIKVMEKIREKINIIDEILESNSCKATQEFLGLN